MKLLLTGLVMLMALQASASEQMRIVMLDSSCILSGKINVGAEVRTGKGKLKKTHNLQGRMPAYRAHLSIDEGVQYGPTSFGYNLARVYDTGKDPVIRGYFGFDSTDTASLTVHIPRPVYCALPENRYHIPVNTPYAVPMQLLLDNGSWVSVDRNPQFMTLVSDIPEAYRIPASGNRVMFSAQEYMDSASWTYQIKGLEQPVKITLYPSYIYHAVVTGIGEQGDKGWTGNSGHSGSAGRNADGQQGQDGDWGRTGSNGRNAVLYLRTLESGIVLAQVYKDGSASENWYLDLAHGGSMVVNLSGGAGGKGGKGGRGGSGADGTANSQPGYGGRGGNGGHGGSGGDGGSLKVYADSAAMPYVSQIHLYNAGGEGGEGGSGGGGGFGGTAYQAKGWSLIFTGRGGYSGRDGCRGQSGRPGPPMQVIAW